MMSDNRSVPDKTSGVVTSSISSINVQSIAHILHLCLVRFGTDSNYNVSPMKKKKNLKARRTLAQLQTASRQRPLEAVLCADK